MLYLKETRWLQLQSSLRGVGGRCGLEAETPDRIEEASGGRAKASSFILVWSIHDAGACLDAGAAIKAARTCYYEMFHRLLTEQDGAQKTGSLADFLAKSL